MLSEEILICRYGKKIVFDAKAILMEESDGDLSDICRAIKILVNADMYNERILSVIKNMRSSLLSFANAAYLVEYTTRPERSADALKQMKAICGYQPKGQQEVRHIVDVVSETRQERYLSAGLTNKVKWTEIEKMMMALSNKRMRNDE